MENNYPVPLILTCKVTGKVVKYYSRPYIEDRITKAGSLDNLVNNFMAKGAKKKNNAKVAIPDKTWNGKKIIQTPEEDTSPVSSETTNKGEKVFEYSDGGKCRVTYS
jgi:hypothetical protein